MSFAERYGPWALVAGASQGIGAAFAQQLAASGRERMLTSRHAHDHEQRLQCTSSTSRAGGQTG